MFGEMYSHDELNKYIAIFGSLFNNIIISRDDENGKAQQRLPIPIQYGPREKPMARTESDPNLDRPYAELLPRMTFEILDMEYDAKRKRPSTQRWATRKVNGDLKVSYDSMFMPVPYNITFELSIMANRAKDAFRIVSSILPHFKPDITVSANIVDEMPDYTLDIPIVYNGITHEDDYEGDYTKPRKITWKLTFVLKGEFFGPVSEAKIIKIAKVNLYADDKGVFHDTPDETITVQPGLTVDGKPTSNAALSIPVYQIDAEDNWGYVTVITSSEG